MRGYRLYENIDPHSEIKAIISTKGKFHIDNEAQNGTVYTVKIPVACVISDKK